MAAHRCSPFITRRKRPTRRAGWPHPFRDDFFGRARDDILLKRRLANRSLTMKGEAAMLTYNVFRSTRTDVYCAVPEDRTVPTFLSSSNAWAFAGRIDRRSSSLNPAAAAEGVRLNGFYLFQPVPSQKLAA
jgi:hypothetical protein